MCPNRVPSLHLHQSLIRTHEIFLLAGAPVNATVPPRVAEILRCRATRAFMALGTRPYFPETCLDGAERFRVAPLMSICPYDVAQT